MKYKRMISIFGLIILFIFISNKMFLKYSEENEKITFESLKRKFSLSQDYKEGTTYYVSATGNSLNGTDINDPMSLVTVNTKKFFYGDRILFKRGDIFYGQLNINIDNTNNGKMIYFGAYGEGKNPTFSAAKIVVDNANWEKYQDKIYRINIDDENNFEGLKYHTIDSKNIGFMQTENGKIYGNLKNNIEELTSDYDFYFDLKYLYIKSEKNPGELLGKVSFATKLDLIKMPSNSEFENIDLKDTSAHGFVKKEKDIENVYIHNCTINYIGGSLQFWIDSDSKTRYGNGIEFWNGAKNVIIENNIINDIYDAAITFQGNDGKFENIEIKNNIITNTSYSFELWASGTSTGMTNVNIYNNITINQGKGWGQQVRPNPHNSAEYVFYSYAKDARMDINIYNNTYYNSTRLYYVLYTIKDRFKKEVKIDNNKFREQEEIYIVNDNKNAEVKEYLNKEYNIDQNSTFRLLTDQDLTQINNLTILTSNNYTEIKTYYETLEKDFTYTDAITPIQEKYTQFKQQNQTIITTAGLATKITQLETYLQQANSTNTTQANLTQQINQTYELGTTILTTYLNNNLNITEGELLSILQQINEIGQTYNTLYSLLQTQETVDFTNIQNQITETEQVIAQYQTIGLTQVTTLINNSKTAIQSELQYTIKSTAATYLVDWAQKLLDIDIINYINQNPPDLTYSTTSLTNKDVTVTMTTNYYIQITNNNGSPTYTFTKNGSFTFQYTVRNKQYTVTAMVTNIDKTPPTITGVEEGKLYYIEQEIVPQITDANLKEVTLYINGVQIDYDIGQPLIVEGLYKMVATDEAGNTKTVQFQVMEKPEEKYIMQEKSIQNIKYNTTKTKFDAKVKIQETYIIERKTENETIQLKSKDTIASGDILTTASGKKYTLIVAGDLTKDGLVDIQDFVRMRRYLLGLRELDEVEILAADANVDSKDLSISDYIRIRILILNQLAGI